MNRQPSLKVKQATTALRNALDGRGGLGVVRAAERFLEAFQEQYGAPQVDLDMVDLLVEDATSEPETGLEGQETDARFMALAPDLLRRMAAELRYLRARIPE